MEVKLIEPFHVGYQTVRLAKAETFSFDFIMLSFKWFRMKSRIWPFPEKFEFGNFQGSSNSTVILERLGDKEHSSS